MAINLDGEDIPDNNTKLIAFAPLSKPSLDKKEKFLTDSELTI